ncbi:MAG: sulfatase [Planctomycetota bacterium]
MRSCMLLILVLLTATAVAATPPTPNIVVIFIDDMGYGDVEFNGGVGPRTPNLNQMAAEGMKFTDFYVGCAVCSGSRAALLTGTHYQRLGIPGVLFPDGQRGLHPDEHTIADMLKDAGYATACVGKWHLGHLPPCLPTYQGFETYFGIPYSNDMWIDPANRLSSDIVLREGVTMSDLKSGQTIKESVPLMRDEEIVEYPCNQSTITKRYTEESIRFIKNHLESPFFLYLPHTMVHRPLAVSDSFANRTGSLLFDAIEEVDWSVGEILRTLRSEGIADRTLVIFTSDNGAALGSSAPLRAKKFSVYDGGIREPTLMWWPGKIPAGSVCREIAASIDILPTLSKLCQGRLSDHPVDGRDIWPLMSDPNATSPHDAFVLSHGPGTVRRGKWKFYPWREKATGRDAPVGRDPSPEPVQLYDLSTDIGETKNLAALHPEVCRDLQARFDKHAADIKSSEREAASLKRPSDAPPPTRPKRRS